MNYSPQETIVKTDKIHTFVQEPKLFWYILVIQLVFDQHSYIAQGGMIIDLDIAQFKVPVPWADLQHHSQHARLGEGVNLQAGGGGLVDDFHFVEHFQGEVLAFVVVEQFQGPAFGVHGVGNFLLGHDLGTHLHNRKLNCG